MDKAVIFDLDGTLANTMPDIQTATNAMLVKLGYPQKTTAELQKIVNNGIRDYVRLALPKEVQSIDFIIESALFAYEEEYAKCFCEKTCAYENVDKLLNRLKGEGYKLAVLSNKQDHFVAKIIDELFEHKLFSEVWGQRNFPPKPHPSGALGLCKALGVKPMNAVLVGDSATDVKTSINSGMRIVGVSWGYSDIDVLHGAGALYIANTPDEIFSLVNDFYNN